MIEKCCNYEQETITLRLDLNNLKERVACQRAIMDRVLDDLRDVNGELKTLVDGLPSVDFFLLQPVILLCAKCRTPHAVIDPDPCLRYRADLKRYQREGSKS